MDPKLDRKLVESYPEIFAGRNASPQTNLMCFGFECGDGWYDLINNLCWTIQSHINHNRQAVAWATEHNRKIKEDPSYIGRGGNPYEPREVPDIVEQVVAMQVKEKFGTLRFYFSGGDEYIEGAVQLAENMSASLCETCGARAKTRDGGWIKTLCDAHHIKD